MGKQTTFLKGWLYCYKRSNTTVFVNRKDIVIKEFKNYDDAIAYANKNMHLINKDFKRVIKKQKK